MYNNTNLNNNNKNDQHYIIENIIMIIIIFSISFISAYIPIKIIIKINKKLIGILKGIESGIFLSITFIILFPFNRKLFKEEKNDFPKSIFFPLIGYSIIFFCELILLNEEEIIKLNLNETKRLNSNIKEMKFNEENYIKYFSYPKRIMILLTNSSNKNLNFKRIKSMNEINNNLLEENLISITKKIRTQSIDLKKEKINSFKNTKIISYLSIFIYSIHSIFEGIILSLLINNKKQVIILFICICYHKIIELICFGLVIYKLRILKNEILKFIIIISLCCPIGIILGNFFFVFKNYFFAICSGTFLYISTTEIIIEEFTFSKYKKEKFIGFLFGVFIIFIINLI